MFGYSFLKLRGFISYHFLFGRHKQTVEDACDDQDGKK